MHITTLLEKAYAITGLLMALFLLVVAYLMGKKEVIGRLFLKHKQFKRAVYVLAIGAAAFFVGNILNIALNNEIYHELSEIALNLSMIVFAILFICINLPYLKFKNKFKEVKR
jgi:SNF family Na+-dependent transporter